MIMENDFTTTKYKRSDLEEYLKTLQAEKLIAIAENKIRKLESQDCWSSAFAELQVCLLDYARELASREFSPKHDKKGAFIDNALEAYPGSLENAWSNTCYKDTYLFLNKLRTSDPLIYQRIFSDLYDLEVRLGRFCASGKYASLRIKHVYQHVYFKINEYDGREYISGLV